VLIVKSQAIHQLKNGPARGHFLSGGVAAQSGRTDSEIRESD